MGADANLGVDLEADDHDKQLVRLFKRSARLSYAIRRRAQRFSGLRQNQRWLSGSDADGRGLGARNR